MTKPDTKELAAALRQWRERLSPHDVGLSAGSARRRTPGLRREEVAHTAGVSPEYIVRLEQARGPRPSLSVLSALARALRLSTAETEHLFHLAGVALPGPDTISDTVRPSILRLLDRMRDLPAMLVNARGDILCWNDLAAALLGDLAALPPARRNHLWLLFGPGDVIRSRLVTEGDEGLRHDRSTVSEARAALARYPGDERLTALVGELRAVSPRFAALWNERAVGSRHADVKSYDVPGIGRITLDCERLDVPDADQKLIVYSATPRTSDAEKLDLLRVVGLQAV